MRRTQRIDLWSGLAALALFCFSAASVQAQGGTYNLDNIASGNWNTANVRTSDNYQIGFSTEHPVEQAAYYEFDLTPVQGKTISSANMLIIGSTDYHISTFWPNHPGSPPQVWFKVGIVPMTISLNSVDQIVTGNNIPGLYSGQIGSNSKDNGYRWVMDGLHAGARFDAWHYEATSGRGHRLQNAVTAGGLFVMFAADRFDSGNDGENYIWGSTSFDSGNQLQIITSN